MTPLGRGAVVGLLFLVISTTPAFTAGPPPPEDGTTTISKENYEILRNVNRLINPIKKLIVYFSYTMGVTFFFMAFVRLGTFNSQFRTTLNRGSITDFLGYMSVGVIFLNLPMFITEFQHWVFGQSPTDVLSYTNDLNQQTNPTRMIFTVALNMVNVIGLGSFVYGWYLLRSASGEGQTQQAFSRGIRQIIGGFIMLNITTFILWLARQLGGGAAELAEGLIKQ